MTRVKLTATVLIGMAVLAVVGVGIRVVWKLRHTAVAATESNPLTKVDLRILRAQQKIAKAPGKA